MDSGAGQARSRDFPGWLAYLDSVLPVTSVFILHGNIRDLHLLPAADGAGTFQRTPAALREVFARSGMPNMVYFSPLHGLAIQPGSDETVVRRVLGPYAAALGSTPAFADIADIVRRVADHRDDPCALAVDYLSQVVARGPGEDPPADDPRPLYLAILRIAHEAVAHPRRGGPRSPLRNPVVVIVDRPNDLPAWLLTGDGIRQAPVPVPDLHTRARSVNVLAPALFQGEDAALSEDERVEIAKRFTDATHGLTLRSMVSIIQLRSDAAIPARQIQDAVRRFRVGIVRDPWRNDELHRRIAQGQPALERRVKGQPRAVRHALDILVRSVSGMTAAHRGERGDGPRGVMFFAGPTGVGKTELAKAIAELLFGDESAFVRFDMSEFADAESDARLIGSPPGYVNHDAGGELTNAVRDQPFSVLLFDEIEKADRRVLDKFLQILSDGRLTDGSGDTVFFSEALIVFTSNLGIGEPGTTADANAADAAGYERNVQDAIRDAFTRRLNRPELLGRIGDNIVVFDHLTRPVARAIADGYVSNVLARVLREQRITLTLPDPVRVDVVDRAVADLSLGARGVGNNLETAFVNPVARAVFDLNAGDVRTIDTVSEDTRGIVTVELS